MAPAGRSDERQKEWLEGEGRTWTHVEPHTPVGWW